MKPYVSHCRTCGGQGYIDEDDALRLGILWWMEGRTEVCPTCRGSGAPVGVSVVDWLAIAAAIICFVALAWMGSPHG